MKKLLKTTVTSVIVLMMAFSFSANVFAASNSSKLKEWVIIYDVPGDATVNSDKLKEWVIIYDVPAETTAVSIPQVPDCDLPDATGVY